MVFPSLPVYVDPPNWNQQQIRPQAIGGAGDGGGGIRLPPAAPPRPEGSTRAGSMTDRARQAKIPLPEAGLQCPRCESTNTKFCYFNNYSLSQPRHFCKACRRYWTRGGALRNVPVGGGCRRNKRTKGGGGSKSSVSSTQTSISAASSNSAIPSNLLPQPTLPFFPSMHAMPAFSGAMSVGSSFDVQPVDAVSFHGGDNSSTAILDQWRLQQVHQFSFMGALEAPPPPLSMGLFPFDGQGCYAGQTQDNSLAAPPVKEDEDARELTLRKHYLGISKSDQFWGDGSGGSGGGSGGGGGVWADISGFSPASTGNIL